MPLFDTQLNDDDNTILGMTAFADGAIEYLYQLELYGKISTITVDKYDQRDQLVMQVSFEQVKLALLKKGSMNVLGCTFDGYILYTAQEIEQLSLHLYRNYGDWVKFVFAGGHRDDFPWRPKK